MPCFLHCSINVEQSYLLRRNNRNRSDSCYRQTSDHELLRSGDMMTEKQNSMQTHSWSMELKRTLWFLSLMWHWCILVFSDWCILVFSDFIFMYNPAPSLAVFDTDTKNASYFYLLWQQSEKNQALWTFTTRTCITLAPTIFHHDVRRGPHALHFFRNYWQLIKVEGEGIPS